MTHARLSIVLDADFGCDSSPGRKGHYDPRTSNQLMISVALLAILIDHESWICRRAIQMVQEGSDSPVVVAKRPSRGAPKSITRNVAQNSGGGTGEVVSQTPTAKAIETIELA